MQQDMLICKMPSCMPPYAPSLLSQAQASRMDPTPDMLEGIIEWDIVEYQNSALQEAAGHLPNRLGKVVKVGHLLVQCERQGNQEGKPRSRGELTSLGPGGCYGMCSQCQDVVFFWLSADWGCRRHRGAPCRRGARGAASVEVTCLESVQVPAPGTSGPSDRQFIRPDLPPSCSQEAGIWVTDDSISEPVAVAVGGLVRVVPAEYGQRQVRGPSNPHGEHAHDIWQVDGSAVQAVQAAGQRLG